VLRAVAFSVGEMTMAKRAEPERGIEIQIGSYTRISNTNLTIIAFCVSELQNIPEHGFSKFQFSTHQEPVYATSGIHTKSLCMLLREYTPRASVCYFGDTHQELVYVTSGLGLKV